MEPLTGSPREDLTADQVRALITGDAVAFTGGLDLLDDDNQYAADLSDVLDERGSSVSWDNRDAVHASCRLAISRQLTWGRARVRPWLEVASGALTARFHLGVFVLTAPDERRGEDPVTYEVTGYDVLTLLQTGPADTYTVTAGTTYYDALQQVIDDSGTGLRLLLDGTAQDTEIPATRVWALTDPITSWLRIMYDLLAEIGYTPPWADGDGNVRSRPHLDLASRPVEWALDTSDARTNLVTEDRTLTIEAGDIANWWRFVRTNIDTTPVEGDGIYTVTNQSTGDSSIDALNRVIRKVVRVDAADQAALETQGDRIVAGDMAAVRTINLTIDPLPVMGYEDVFQYTDNEATEKIAAASWTINLDGSPGQLQLGGAPREPLDQISAQAKATVTDDAPLRVVVDGATVDSFANALDAATYAIGDRVTVTIRNPLPPLVAGVES